MWRATANAGGCVNFGPKSCAGNHSANRDRCVDAHAAANDNPDSSLHANADTGTTNPNADAPDSYAGAAHSNSGADTDHDNRTDSGDVSRGRGRAGIVQERHEV